MRIRINITAREGDSRKRVITPKTNIIRIAISII